MIFYFLWIRVGIPFFFQRQSLTCKSKVITFKSHDISCRKMELFQDCSVWTVLSARILIRQSHRIIERFGLESIFKDHQVHPFTTPLFNTPKGWNRAKQPWVSLDRSVCSKPHPTWPWTLLMVNLPGQLAPVPHCSLCQEFLSYRKEI